MPITKSRLGSRGRPEQSRAAILQAAVREFSREGVAGARIDAIARAARVNKALLYYYFKDKEALYSAVLDHVFGGLTTAVNAAFALNVRPREKVLAYAGAHFDYVASHPLYPRIVQGEMMSAGRIGSSHLHRIVQQYFHPLTRQLIQVLTEGMAAGEFRSVDPMQVVPSIVAVIVFYFINAPAMRSMTGIDPLEPKRVAARRAAVLDFISSALMPQSPSRRKGSRK
ncbi:MAG TPA: TetR/AcrR family transcriptional regulator [Terriglobales bacterium]|nr:TetR/AcrR family transcriptional regulator [Terriglobales bacterium]